MAEINNSWCTMWLITDGQPLVYLMLNCRNKYTKIGKSLTPEYREKTLQSEEPEVHLLATIRGGAAMERELHLRYADKRIRGEWFDLSQYDYDEIFLQYKVCLADDVRFAAMRNGVSFEEAAEIMGAM